MSVLQESTYLTQIDEKDDVVKLETRATFSFLPYYDVILCMRIEKGRTSLKHAIFFQVAEENISLEKLKSIANELKLIRPVQHTMSTFIGNDEVK